MSWFSFFKKEKKISPVASARAGDVIYINYRHSNDVIICLVENNDPEDEKIFLALHYKKEKNTCYNKEVFHYSDAALKNFKALNIRQKTIKVEPNAEEFLDLKLNAALQKEEYEKADKLKKAIDILKED